MSSLIRQAIHDNEQARRRTDRQNVVLIAIVVAIGGNSEFGYTDVPPEGGDLEVIHVASNRRFRVACDGITTEITDG